MEHTTTITTIKRSVLSVALAGALAACGGGGGGAASSGGTGGGTGGGVTPSGVLLTGTVASGGSGLSGVDLRYGTLAGGPGGPNEVWAIPIAKMQGANIDPINVMLRETKPLPADGKFEFDLAKTITAAEVKAKVPSVDLSGIPDDYAFDVDWLIVTVDTTSSPVRVVSQVRLGPEGGYGDLFALPISGFKTGENALDLGTIGSDGEAATTTAVMESKTTLSSDSLKTLARADDIMQALKDIVRNCDVSTSKCYSARQSFAFKGEYAALASGYARAVNYSGYQLYFDLNDYYDTTDFDAVCAGTLVYTLTPPGDVTVAGTTYNSTNPMSTGDSSATPEARGSDEMVCSKNGTFLSKRKNSGGEWASWQLQYITGDSATELTADMPAGDWVLKRDGSAIASFEFRAANPIDADGKPIVFVPAVRLLNNTGNTVSAGEKIQTVAVKWYRWDSASADYVEISGADLALLDDLAESFDLGMADFNGKTGNTSQAYPRVDGRSFQHDTSIDVSSWDFYYDYGSEDQYNAAYVGLSYQFGGQSFRFVWRKPGA